MRGKLLMGAAALGLGYAAAGSAAAQETVVYFAAYGGSFEQMMREELIPAFEARHGVRVEYVAGNSTDNIARLVAQRDNQQIDVVIVDDGPMYQAIALGLCRELEPAAIYDDLYDLASYPGNLAVGAGAVGTGIMYNEAYFAEQGWAAPTSWNDLADPKYKGLLVVPPLNNTYGLHALVIAARMAGGGEEDIEAGFEAYKGPIGENVLTYEPSPGKMTELFQSSQAVIAVWGSGRAKALQDTGFPAAFLYPEEGGVALGIAACAVAGGQDKPEAQALVQFLLEPESQKIMAERSGIGPVNRNVELSDEVAAAVPYGPEQMEKLMTIAWDVVNPLREEWNRRWTREVER